MSWSFIRSVFNGRMCPAAAGFVLNGVNFTPVPDTTQGNAFSLANVYLTAYTPRTSQLIYYALAAAAAREEDEPTSLCVRAVYIGESISVCTICKAF